MAAIPESQSQHEDAVVHAEVRKLVRALAPYRVMHRDALKRVAGAEHWRECSFEQALALAARTGALERLPGEFYATPPTRKRTRSARRRQRDTVRAGDPAAGSGELARDRVRAAPARSPRSIRAR